MPRTLRLALLVSAALLAAAPAAAQTAPRELRVRMRQFARVVAEGEEGTKMIRFFPRRATFEVVLAPDPGGAAGPTHRRALRPDSLRAYLESTDSFCAFGGALEGVEDGWRYAGEGRFVPPRHDPDGTQSVEWMRERGIWVVRRVIEGYLMPPRVLGTPVGEMTRDTTAFSWLPAERRYATGTEWYRTNQPVIIAGRRLMKYGLPRHLDRSELDPVGTFGVVPFFAAKGNTRALDVVYALVGPDEYQPYQKSGDTLEDICGHWW